jgi:hypothetical protein
MDTEEVLGFDLSDDLAEDEWWEIGERFKREQSLTAWRIGDWLVHAADHYDGGEQSDSRYTRASDLTDLSYGTLRNRASVARRFEMSRRRDTLTFEHHAVVASLRNDVEQDRWLGKAEKNRWSVRDLKRHKSEAKPKAMSSSKAEKPEKVKLTITFSGQDADLRERIYRIADESERGMNAWCVDALREAVEAVERQESVAA